MGKRIEYLDFLKFFAIFSVLLGHSTEQISADLFWDHPLWEFIYSYHMPLFMFLCGFFFRSSLKKPFAEMAADKFCQLGVPSLTAFAIDWYNLAITLYRLAIGMTGTMTFFLLARPVYGFLSKFSFMPLLCRGLTPLHL